MYTSTFLKHDKEIEKNKRKLSIVNHKDFLLWLDQTIDQVLIPKVVGSSSTGNTIREDTNKQVFGLQKIHVMRTWQV